MSASPAEMGNLVVAGGFSVALLFGLVAARTNFCTMGALSDIVNMQHWGRMRMWLLAVAVAIAGATALRHGGQIDLAKAVAMRPNLSWLSLLVGLAAGCGGTYSRFMAVTPAATSTPTCACTEKGCRLNERLEPPTSAFAPRPTPAVADAPTPP